MKRDQLLTAIWGAALGCLLSLGSVMCMVTAFDLQVNVGALAVCCVTAALVCSLCYVLPLGLLPLGAGAVVLGFLWRNGSLEQSLEALLNRLSRQYDKAYGWGIIRWGFRTADDMEPTILLMLCIFGVLIAMAVTWSVCRGKTSLPGVLLSMLCAGSCFVVTDTVPDTVWLYFLLLGVVILLLTSRVRRQDAQQGNRLSLLAAPAAALALLVLLAAVPQKTYNGQAAAQRLTELFLNTDPMLLLTGQEGGGIASGAGSGSVDLTAVGYRSTSQSAILEVTAEFDGTLYLRSRAMNTYDGTSWSDSADGISWEMLQWPSYDLVGDVGQVTVTTRYAHRMLYTPYYIDISQIKDAPTGMQNTAGKTEYSFRCLQMKNKSYLTQLYPTPNTKPLEWPGDLLTQFISLPDDVMAWAEPLAKEITGDVASPYHRAQAIANYVRDSAAYDTNTPRMPGRQRDFARWFLEESDTGYCVHFASAAAVLLQASGIPARYVTGYTAQVSAGQTTVVTADRAHAWVEYYLPGFGWTVLEATPAAQEQIPQQSQDTTQAIEDDRQPTADGETAATQEPSQKAQRQNSGVILTVLAVIAALAALAALVWGQYRLRIYLKIRRYRQCAPNERAILQWQETVRFAGLLGEAPDRTLFDLAQKARFSQHTITQPELEQFDAYAAAAKEKLRKHSVFHRFWYRVILAVY